MGHTLKTEKRTPLTLTPPITRLLPRLFLSGHSFNYEEVAILFFITTQREEYDLLNLQLQGSPTVLERLQPDNLIILLWTVQLGTTSDRAAEIQGSHLVFDPGANCYYTHHLDLWDHSSISTRSTTLQLRNLHGHYILLIFIRFRGPPNNLNWVTGRASF